MTARENTYRFKAELGFTYAATQEQIQKFCEHMRYFLVQDSTVDQERIVVNFIEFAESSMNVLVRFHYKLVDPTQEFKVAEGYLFQIQKVANEQNLSFAFPTRTLLVENKMN